MKLSASLKTHTRLSLNAHLEIRELVYLILFSCFAVLNILERSLLNIHLIYQAFVLLMLGTLAVLFILQRGKLPLWKLMLIAVVFALFSAAAIITDKTTLLLSAMLLITADQAKYERVVICALVFTLPSLLFVMACSQVGIIPDYTFMHEGKVAHSMGYSYYSTVPYVLLFLMICYLYLRGKRILWAEIIGLLICNELIYHISTTRLPYFLFMLITLMYVVLVKYDWFHSVNHPFFKLLAFAMYPALFGITIWSATSYTYTSRIWRTLNEITNARIALSNQAFQLYHPKLLGQFIRMVGNGAGDSGAYFYIDSGYVYSYLSNGILMTFVLLGIYAVMSYLACCANNKRLLVWLAAIAMFSVINNVWTSVSYNPLLLSFLPLLMDAKRLRQQNRMPKPVQQIETLQHGEG